MATNTTTAPSPGTTTKARSSSAARDLGGEVAFLTRALKAPTLRESVPRLAQRARAENWSHEEFSPTNVLADGIDGGVPVLNAVLGAAKVAKIRALAVAEDARGMGIGETLIRRSVAIYPYPYARSRVLLASGSQLTSTRRPACRCSCPLRIRGDGLREWVLLRHR